MPDTFTRIEQDLESEGTGGIADELRKAATEKRQQMVDKLTAGQCKSMESYADAVGVIRGLDFLLNYAKNKAEEIKKQMTAEEEEIEFGRRP